MGKNSGCERALCPSRKTKGAQRLGTGTHPDRGTGQACLHCRVQASREEVLLQASSF